MIFGNDSMAQNLSKRLSDAFSQFKEKYWTGIGCGTYSLEGQDYFMIMELHKPECASNNPMNIRKAVIKMKGADYGY